LIFIIHYCGLPEIRDRWREREANLRLREKERGYKAEKKTREEMG
jgi:hypothetical protein